MVPPPATTANAHPHDHLVGFYEDPAFLASSVARYLAPAFEGDGAALVIATAEHTEQLEPALRALGLDPDDDRLITLDADRTLEAVLQPDGSVDRDRFWSLISGALDDLLDRGRRVYAFGELVALLWERGAVTQALEIESLWNDLAVSRPFSLFCGYPLSVFAHEQHTVDFRTVCDVHSAVIPSESYSELLDPAEQQRAVAILRQEAVASANERDALLRSHAGLAAELDELGEFDRLQRQFTAMLVHDLRSPTVIVAGLLQLLAEHLDELSSEDVRGHLETAAASAARMERLIDDMLAMSRLESGQFRYDLQRMDLRSIVADVAADVTSATGRVIDVDVPVSLREAYADSGRQQQVLDNLLTNAVKFSPAGSPVRVRVEDTGDDHLVVHVEDRGQGIHPDDVERLFLPFSRVSRRPGGPRGTGLGLYITKALVEGQGGTIGVTSEPDTGSVFTYSVPVAA